ncbi:MAG TPA: CoA ester lyase [Gaiellaceae bacterium]|nr:CoA ester lyase [Gaiellaceae bacterium]
MNATRLRRSCLAVPGSSDKMLAKAAALPADEVFLDLEDAVAPLEKNDVTRQKVVDALRHQEWRAQTKVVRVNAVSTPWCFRDIAYVVEGAGAALDCIMLPKVETPGDVHFADRLLTQLEAEFVLPQRIGLEVQIESPLGLVHVEAIAASSPRIETLIFGPGDFAASTGMPELTVGAVDGDYAGDQWHYVLWRILIAARAFGLQAIDGPYAQIRDPEGFRQVARRSRTLGFDGKWALHPDQIEFCNEIFSPSPAEFGRASRILSAYAEATDGNRLGAVMFEGEMIDEASRKMAEQVLARGLAAGHGSR